MAEVEREASVLQIELERAKESLKDVDDSIKKLTGREPTEQRGVQRRVSLGSPPLESRGPFPGGRFRTLSGPGGERGRVSLSSPGDIRGRLFALARRGITDGDGPPAKRRTVTTVGGAFSRLGPRRPGLRDVDSGEEDDIPNKPTIQSSVVATPGVIRTRKESIDQQSKDAKGMARNRRMFGALLGTLQKFKTEAKETKDKDDQRRQIEVKLEDKAKQEKEDARMERQQLFKERREKQVQVQILEQKMELVDMHDMWEKETKKLKHFLHTKAKPHVFYKPRSQDSSDSRVKDTRKFVDDMIKERRKKLEEELEELTRRLLRGDNKQEDDENEVEGEDMEAEEEGENEREDKGKERKGLRPEKRVENKENVKRKGDRKRRKSREFQVEEEEDEVNMEEEASVSQVSMETGNGEIGEGETGEGLEETHTDTTEVAQQDDKQADEALEEGSAETENQKRTSEDPAENVGDDDRAERTEGDGKEGGEGNCGKVVEDEESEFREKGRLGDTGNDISRRVILAEDEDDATGAESLKNADPEEADE